MKRINVRPETFPEMRQRMGILSVSDVANRLGVVLKTFWRHSKNNPDCPKPSVQFGEGSRLYYQESDLTALKKYCQQKGLLE